MSYYYFQENNGEWYRLDLTTGAIEDKYGDDVKSCLAPASSSYYYIVPQELRERLITIIERYKDNQIVIDGIAAYPFLKKEERAIFCSYMERYAALDLRFNLDYPMCDNPLYPNYSALCYILQHFPIKYPTASVIVNKYVEGLTDDLQKSFPNVPSIHAIVGRVTTFWCMIGQSRAAYVSLIRFFLREKLYVFEMTTIAPPYSG